MVSLVHWVKSEVSILWSGIHISSSRVSQSTKLHSLRTKGTSENAPNPPTPFGLTVTASFRCAKVDIWLEIFEVGLIFKLWTATEVNLMGNDDLWKLICIEHACINHMIINRTPLISYFSMTYANPTSSLSLIYLYMVKYKYTWYMNCYLSKS